VTATADGRAHARFARVAQRLLSHPQQEDSRMWNARAGVCVMTTLALTACGGGGGTDIDATLVFAERSDAEIARLISAAGGSDLFGAQAQVSQFANETDPCPAVAISGQT